MASNDMHRSIGTYRTANLVDLKSLSEVCRHGPSPRIAAARPDKHWESVRNQIFEEVRDRALIRVPHQDRALLDRIGYLSIQGRKAASTGDKVESRRLFASAQEALTKAENIREETHLLCVVEQAAAEAYLDCSCGDNVGAHHKLRDSYNAASRLSREFGYSAMSSHRIHLLNNVIRIEALAENYGYALDLCRSLLRYLGGGGRIDLCGLERNGWELASTREGDAWNISGAVNAFLTSQTLHELALLLAMLDYTEARHYTRALFEDNEVSTMRSSWPRAFGAWFDLKHHFLMGTAIGELLKLSYSFLSGEDGTASLLLWFTVALDVAAVCDRLPGGGGLERIVLEGPASYSVPRLIPPTRLQVSKRWARI